MGGGREIGIKWPAGGSLLWGSRTLAVGGLGSGSGGSWGGDGWGHRGRVQAVQGREAALSLSLGSGACLPVCMHGGWVKGTWAGHCPLVVVHRTLPQLQFTDP